MLSNVIEKHRFVSRNRNVFAQLEFPMSNLSPYCSIICIVSFVMHNQLIINKVEAVRASLKGVFNHKVDGSLVKFRKLVDMLAGVFAIGYAEAEIKVKCFQVLIPEKVSFDHSEILDWSATHTELNSCPNCT
jgi:hypothetical protein